MVVKRGSRYFVESETTGRNLGKKEGYESEKKARQRLHLVEYFKSMKGKPKRSGGVF